MNKIDEIIDNLNSKIFRNMGQTTLYIKTGLCIIQKRGEGHFIVYFFDNKGSKLELDPKECNRFKKMNQEELHNFLSTNLDE